MHWEKHYKENNTLGKTLQRKLCIGKNTTKKIIHWEKHYKENYTLGKTQHRKLYVGQKASSREE
jgi:hypothetical protein